MSRHNRGGSFTRRTWLRSAAVGAVAWQSHSWLSRLAASMPASSVPRRCILLWMSGGPSQIDTFDPKPDHENGGPFKPIATSVPGLHLGEHLPQLAQLMQHVAVVRSLTSKEGDHDRATRYVQAGYRPGGPLNYPSLGAAVAKQLQPSDSDLPRYVTIAPGLFNRSLGGGFLGPRFAPLAVRESGNPAGSNLQVSNLSAPDSVTPDRLRTRLEMQSLIEQETWASEEELLVASHHAAYAQALRMMQGRAREAFDLSREPAELRDAYGRNVFGQGCLMARRLIEHGVPFVEVSLNSVPEQEIFGWDTHADNFESTKKLCGVLDPAFGTLLKDLKQRGLLEDTLVVWMGEFGRTPTINPAQGRDHFPDAWSAVLAGGGIAGGQAYGATSTDGQTVVDRPVQVPDFLATVCEALGVNWHEQNMSNIGRPIRVVDPEAQPLREVLA